MSRLKQKLVNLLSGIACEMSMIRQLSEVAGLGQFQHSNTVAG